MYGMMDRMYGFMYGMTVGDGSHHWDFRISALINFDLLFTVCTLIP